jgi:hypothetical protein
MAAGVQLTQQGFNAQIGSLAQTLDGVMTQWHQMRTYIIGAGGGLAGLQIAPLSLSTADATVAFNSAADLEQFYQIYIGANSQSTLRGNSNPYDYRTNAGLLAGTNVH